MRVKNVVFLLVFSEFMEVKIGPPISDFGYL